MRTNPSNQGVWMAIPMKWNHNGNLSVLGRTIGPVTCTISLNFWQIIKANNTLFNKKIMVGECFAAFFLLLYTYHSFHNYSFNHCFQISQVELTHGVNMST
jgi:hypothetical protein